MNYRHIYHAGNFADVLKHIVLLWVLEYLKKKEKPFFALDTHAGIGLYPFKAAEAQKTKEYESGVLKVLSDPHPPEFIQAYFQAIQKCNLAGIENYPGSPLLIADQLRESDRFIANELHPADALTLRKNMKAYKNTRVSEVDAYECLKASLPPEIKRGLILIDPPFEIPDEFGAMVRAMRQALKRWQTGIYLLWYPIKNKPDVLHFQNELRQECPVETLRVDFYRQHPKDPKIFNGTGLMILNPPWGLEDDLRNKILPYLQAILCPETGFWEISILPVHGAVSP